MTNQLKEALKPCPFCGGDAELIKQEEDLWLVRCNTAMCIMELGTDCIVGRERAVSKWNTRTFAESHAEGEGEEEAIKSMLARITGNYGRSMNLATENARLREAFLVGRKSARSFAPVSCSWVIAKPDYACVFLTRSKLRDRWDYDLWSFEWAQGEPPEGQQEEYEGTRYYYLAWLDHDGEEYADREECAATEYLVVATLPNKNEIHKEWIKSLK